MHHRFGIIGAALLLSLAAGSGCDSGDKDGAKDKTAASATAASAKASAAAPAKSSAAKPEKAMGGGDTPDDTFKKVSKAAADEDYRTYFLMFSPKAQNEALAGIIIGATITLVPFGTKPNPDKQKQLLAIFQKHGFDKIPDAPAGAGPEQAIKALTERLNKVKDRPGMFADLMNYLEKNSLAKKEERGEKLENLKIEGDQANGTAVVKDKSGKISRAPIQFSKIDGRWYIASMKALAI